MNRQVLLVSCLLVVSCGGRHVWVNDGFFMPQAYQWCARHKEYHPVAYRHGPDGKPLVSGSAKRKVLELD